MLRVSRQAETFAIHLAASTKLYRGLNLDTRAPGMEKVHQMLQQPSGWDHPDLGGHILDWLHQGPKKGIGGHWTADPTQAEQFARWPNEQTGRGGNLQAIIEADWGGHGEDTGRTDTHEFDEKGNRIRSFPDEQETTLSPGAEVNVTGVRVRPYDDEYWNGPSDGGDPDSEHDGPWHSVFGQPSARQAFIDDTPWLNAAWDDDEDDDEEVHHVHQAR